MYVCLLAGPASLLMSLYMREQLLSFKGLLPESHVQTLALTVSHLPHSLDSGGMPAASGWHLNAAPGRQKNAFKDFHLKAEARIWP